MSNLPAVQELTKSLASQSKSIESMLPPSMDPKRFLRTAVNAISTHAQCDALLKADRQSLFNACQKAASDGLVIDGKESTLVTFKGQVAYMPMVQGLVKLARNSGQIKKIVAEVVFKNDEFSYRPGLDDMPNHSPDWFGDRGEPIGCYAVITLNDGEQVTAVMNKARIMGIAQGGRNSHQYTPGKGPHYQEWWKKTVIKNVLKYAPKSTYLESAMEHDNENYDPDAAADYENVAKTDSINADFDIKKDTPAKPEPEAIPEVEVIEGEVVNDDDII